MVEYIILSVQRNALGVMEGIVEMQRIDASVSRGGRCYHWLRSYADSVLNRKMGLLLDDGMDRINAIWKLMMAML